MPSVSCIYSATYGRCWRGPRAQTGLRGIELLQGQPCLQGSVCRPRELFSLAVLFRGFELLDHSRRFAWPPSKACVAESPNSWCRAVHRPQPVLLLCADINLCYCCAQAFVHAVIEFCKTSSLQAGVSWSQSRRGSTGVSAWANRAHASSQPRAAEASSDVLLALLGNATVGSHSHDMATLLPWQDPLLLARFPNTSLPPAGKFPSLHLYLPECSLLCRLKEKRVAMYLALARVGGEEEGSVMFF